MRAFGRINIVPVMRYDGKIADRKGATQQTDQELTDQMIELYYDL